MSRGLRQAPGGFLYHVLNRAVARLPLFEKPADYAAFWRVLAEALEKCPLRTLAFVLMSNHWHFVLWPQGDQDRSHFCRRLAHTHSMRWHAHYHTSGTVHICQGRFKAFPVGTDGLTNGAHRVGIEKYIISLFLAFGLIRVGVESPPHDMDHTSTSSTKRSRKPPPMAARTQGGIGGSVGPSSRAAGSARGGTEGGGTGSASATARASRWLNGARATATSAGVW
jgi:REP element-mobilizing transposase RayT